MAQQDQKISQLTPKAAVDGTEQIPVAHGGQNYTLTPGQLKQYIGGAVDITDMVSGDTISDENLALLKQYVAEGRPITIQGFDAIAIRDDRGISLCAIVGGIESETYENPAPLLQGLFTFIETSSKQITQTVGNFYHVDFMLECIPMAISGLISHGTSHTGTDSEPYALQPFKFHLYGTVARLNLSLAAIKMIYFNANEIMPEYKFQFTSGATPTVLTLPSDVKWASSNVIEANHTYQVSIVNNIAVMIGVEETPHSGGSLE